MEPECKCSCYYWNINRRAAPEAWPPEAVAMTTSEHALVTSASVLMLCKYKWMCYNETICMQWLRAKLTGMLATFWWNKTAVCSALTTVSHRTRSRGSWRLIRLDSNCTPPGAVVTFCDFCAVHTIETSIDMSWLTYLRIVRRQIAVNASAALWRYTLNG